MIAARPDPATVSNKSRMTGALETARTRAGAQMRLLLALQFVRLVLRLAFLAATAFVVGGLVMGQHVAPWMGVAAIAALAGAQIAGLVGDRRLAEAENDVASAVRDHVRRRLDGMTVRQVQAIPTGKLVVSLQRHPGAVAALVVGHRAARMMMAAGPLIAAATLALVSWQAALLVLVLTPVMIVFFALVGDVIRKRAQAQEQAFGHLAGQFADRMRTLPTILANHALDTEHARLTLRLQAYADRTMGVLRTAFLNAAIIDFFASLSIAMLAVFLGLGHLGLASIPGFSGLDLWQSLFILMVAPDYFAPFRRYAEQYHAKAEGEAAATSLDDLLRGNEGDAPPPGLMQRLPVLGELPETGLVALVGPSGSGKTTLLRHLAGVDGSPATIDGSVSWIATDTFIESGSLAQAIGGDKASARRAATMTGLLDDALLPGGLDSTIVRGGANLSGGQRLRVAVARAICRDRAVLADEPTAKLDARVAAKVRDALRTMANSRLVVVATHDEALAAIADRTIRLDAAEMAVDP